MSIQARSDAAPVCFRNTSAWQAGGRASMFNLFFQSTQAFNQVGLFFGAIVIIGLGGLLLGNTIQARLHGYRTLGTIVGAVASGTSYFPVYRYTLPDGQTHLAKSNTGSSSTSGKETGRTVPLLVSANDPNDAQPANNYVFDVIGIVLLACGIGLAYVACTAYPITKMTWVMAIGMSVYLAERGYRAFMPKGPRVSLAEWRQLRHLDQPAIDLADVKPIESLVSSTQAAQLRQKQARNSRLMIPLLLVFAVILFAVGSYQSVRLSRLESVGLRAQGEVVRLKQESGNDGHFTYYPVVRVQLSNNSYFEFKDSLGSNPPGYRRGDQVTVLYLADDPQRSAMIDRGIYWNWAIPAVVFLFAGLALLIPVSLLRTRRSPLPLSTVTG
jgi:Protein of unknown function (DUF3592)